MRYITNRLLLASPLLVILACPLHASLVGIDLFKNVEYTQTSGAAPTVPGGFFLSFRAFFHPGDFDTGSVTYPGPSSPQALSPSGTSLLIFQTALLPSQAVMDAAYPFGTYSYTVSNSGTSATQSADISYLADAYTADIPALTAATYAALQGMNVGSPLTLNFNGFTPIGADAATFLTIFGSPFATSVSNTTTSATIPANTLTAGTTYTFELDFTDRVSGANNRVATQIGFDVRTDVTFTTALAPEPGSMALGALGVAALAFGLRRRRNV